MKVSILLTILVISLFFNAVSFSVLMDNEDEIAQLKEDMSVTDQYNEAIQYIYNVDMYGYIQANDQLIKHSTPSSVNRAIKATPLPKMKG